MLCCDRLLSLRVCSHFVPTPLLAGLYTFEPTVLSILLTDGCRCTHVDLDFVIETSIPSPVTLEPWSEGDLILSTPFGVESPTSKQSVNRPKFESHNS